MPTAAPRDGVKALAVEARETQLAADPAVLHARQHRHDVAEIEPLGDGELAHGIRHHVDDVNPALRIADPQLSATPRCEAERRVAEAGPLTVDEPEHAAADH